MLASVYMSDAIICKIQLNVFNGRPFDNASALAANVFVFIFQVIPSYIYRLAFNKFDVKDL